MVCFPEFLFVQIISQISALRWPLLISSRCYGIVAIWWIILVQRNVDLVWNGLHNFLLMFLNVNTSFAEPPLIGSAASKSKGKVEGSRNYLWLVVIALLNIREGWETFLSIGRCCKYLWLMFEADLVYFVLTQTSRYMVYRGIWYNLLWTDILDY